MKIESATIQPHYVLEPLDGGKVRVSLYANQEEIITEDGSHYLYDHYVVEAIDRPQLAAYISGNLDAWVAAAAEQEYNEVALEVFDNFKGCKILERNTAEPTEGIMTGFEKKYRKEGRPIYRSVVEFEK